MTERLPRPDTALFPPLSSGHVRILGSGQLVGRIHASTGAHPTAWNTFRFFGPTGARFDHQPLPRRLHPARGVFYGAPLLDDDRGRPIPVLRTCVAEVFRDRGAVELSRDAPFFVLFRLARPLRLLDLADSDWVTLAGGNAAISAGLRSTARAWSREIYRRYTDADAVEGVFYTCSNIPPAQSVALFERAADALPARPQVHLPLTHPSLRPELEEYADKLHLHLLP